MSDKWLTRGGGGEGVAGGGGVRESRYVFMFLLCQLDVNVLGMIERNVRPCPFTWHAFTLKPEL